MEKGILNIDNLYITQGMNGKYSHQGNLAIDLANCSYLKAPFTGIIKKKYDYCNAVWLESIDKVLYADGTIDYMTIVTMHDNDISKLELGQIIKQGEVYYHPGVKGNVTGAHIHLSIGKGKFINSGWYKNNYGKWCINNQYDVTKALFLDTNTNIINGIYNWKLNQNHSNKTIHELALEVIKGIWGNGDERKNKLTNSGYNYYIIQDEVNKILNKNTNSKEILYTVKKGDNLSIIAQKYNISTQQLYENNKSIIGNNPNLIYPGQVLKI